VPQASDRKGPDMQVIVRSGHGDEVSMSMKALGRVAAAHVEGKGKTGANHYLEPLVEVGAPGVLWVC
jgi:hypothetical protein